MAADVENAFALAPSQTGVVAERSAQETALDTNGDGRISAADALAVINYIGRLGNAGPGELGSEFPSHLDSNEDGKVTARDALVVINHLAQVPPVANPEAPSFTNPNNPLDVDNSGHVSAEDVDLVLTALERFGFQDIVNLDVEQVGGFVDVNADGTLSGLDLLNLINHLGEGGIEQAPFDTAISESVSP
jgi:hypothetical protein